MCALRKQFRSDLLKEEAVAEAMVMEDDLD